MQAARTVRQARPVLVPIAAATALLVAGAVAHAAEPAQGGAVMAGSGEAVFVAKIVLLLVVGRGLGEILERLGQPAIMGQLIGGILLGPSLFGWVWPEAQQAIFPADPAQKSMIEALSQVGILLLLLLTGMETDLKLVRRVGAACFSISATGIVVPFACGFVLAQFLPASLLPENADHIVAGLFLGTALSISSVKIVAVIVREMGFLRRNLGQVIISSAIIEDTIGWLIIAITFGIATEGGMKLLPLAGTVLGVAAFMAFSFTIGRRLVFTAIRWTNDHVRSEYAVVTVILVIMGLMSLVTDWLGVHSVLGAFVAGILVGESPILTDHIETQLRGIITAFFMPIFFGLAGLSADLTALADPTMALLAAALVVVASVGKFAGAFTGGEMAGMHFRESVAIGSAMNARGSTEVIVATIGLTMGVLSPTLFTMIVTMAVVTTLAMPPMLRWALRRVPIGEAERARLEREELDARGFVSRLERLLLAVDDSAVGKFAAYLAGLVGGGSGMPTTLLRLDRRPAGEGGIAAKRPGKHAEEVKRGARESATAVERDEAVPVEKLHLTARDEAGLDGETIAQEARKGYGMLIVGLGRALTPKGAFTKAVNEIASGFDGPLCLVVKGRAAAGTLPALDADATILVPVNGTEVTRRAADLALALARPHRARVKALHISRKAAGETASLSMRREEAVLKEIVELGERYGVEVETQIRARTASDTAIVRAAAKGPALLVMGVSRRAGEELFFGETSTSVLAKCPIPVVLVAGETARAERGGTEARRSGKADRAEEATDTEKQK